MLSSLEEVQNAVRLKLADYLIEHGIEDPHKKFSCICSSHKDSSPSCSMHKSGIFITCFGCQKSWDIFAVAHELDGYPISGPEFVTENVLKLADKYNIKYSITHNNDEKAALRYGYFRAYKLVADLIETNASENPNDAWKSECRKRKWTGDLKKDVPKSLGCINSLKEIIELLTVNGFTKDFIELIGLMRSDMFNSDNVIFPIRDEYNRVIAFYTRDTKFEDKKAAYDKAVSALDIVKPKMPMKYNSTANFTGIYEKQLFPYGISDTRDFHRIILVEGHGCKLSLGLNGVDNVIALGGLALTDQTIDKLIGLGATALVLCLDNDNHGKDRAKEIIQKYYGKKPVDWFVTDMSGMPEVKDPDEFIRKYSIDAFRQLPEKNALEWYATQELYGDGDPYSMVQKLSPLIAAERSPINRLKIESIIADMTGIDRDVIHAEVEQKISNSKDRKGEYALKILDEAKELVSMNPDALSAALNLIETKVGALNKDNASEDIYSSNECLMALTKMEESEESGEITPTILTGFSDWDKYSPLPATEAYIIVTSPPNSGKSSLFVGLTNNILDLNEDTIVIIHTIDDSRNVYFNRLVAQRCQINMNWLKNPNCYLDEDMKRKRKESYRILADYIRDERLIIKDVSHGDSIEFQGTLIKRIREKYPNKKIVVFCDNFHKLSTELDYSDSRIKYQYISGISKGYTTKFNLVKFDTVELKKENMFQKPQDTNGIKETGSLQYDANMIIYLWSEINALREEAELVFDGKIMDFDAEAGYYYRTEVKPIIEGLVLKNKLSDFKKSFFWKFHPELAIYEDITSTEVKQIVESKKAKKKREVVSSDSD